MIPDPTYASSDATSPPGASSPVEPAGSAEAPAGEGQVVAPNPFSEESFRLNWTQLDIEQRLGFRGGRFTTVNKWLTFLIGLLLTAFFYATLIFGVARVADARWFTAMFTDRGFAPYCTMLLFFWGVAILFIKARKLDLQFEALSLSAVPQQPDFILNRESARAVLRRVHSLVDDASHFLLLNRIERALSNLQNIGQIGDVASILRFQADYDEEQVASSYSLVQSFLWAIPVLGFIGTVIGLRAAIAALGITLRANGDVSAIREGLQAVTAGLATKFETTLVALVCAVILQLLLSFLQSRESEFLDACNDYCHAHVASKLKLE
jgi:biopolymer transport protein ExbB/TolQ